MTRETKGIVVVWVVVLLLACGVGTSVGQNVTEKEALKRAFSLLTSPRHTKKLVSGKDCGSRIHDMRMAGGELRVFNRLKNAYNDPELKDIAPGWFPVSVDGARYRYEAVHYTCTNATAARPNAPPYCPVSYLIEGEILPADHPRIRETVTVGYFIPGGQPQACELLWEVVP